MGEEEEVHDVQAEAHVVGMGVHAAVLRCGVQDGDNAHHVLHDLEGGDVLGVGPKDAFGERKVPVHGHVRHAVGHHRHHDVGRVLDRPVVVDVDVHEQSGRRVVRELQPAHRTGCEMQEERVHPLPVLAVQETHEGDVEPPTVGEGVAHEAVQSVGLGGRPEANHDAPERHERVCRQYDVVPHAKSLHGLRVRTRGDPPHGSVEAGIQQRREEVSGHFFGKVRPSFSLPKRDGTGLVPLVGLCVDAGP